MNTDLNDKTVVITGGSGILGRVMVSELFKAGANVAVLDLREPPTTALPSSPGKSGNRILFTPTDVLKKDSLQTRKALQSGLVLVSTGVWKLEKPSVAGHYVKSST